VQYCAAGELGQDILLYELNAGTQISLAISVVDMCNRAIYCKFNPSITPGFKFGGFGSSSSFKLPQSEVAQG